MDLRDVTTQIIVGVVVGAILTAGGALWAWLRKPRKNPQTAEAPTDIQYHVYISFPTANRPEIERVLPAIDAAGYTFFYDAQVDWEGITPGSDYYAPLEKALQVSRLVLFFVTPNTPSAKGQLWEAKWIYEHPSSSLTTIPFFLVGGTSQDLPQEFERVAGVRIGDDEKTSVGEQVVEAIEKVIGKPEDFPIAPDRIFPGP